MLVNIYSFVTFYLCFKYYGMLCLINVFMFFVFNTRISHIFYLIFKTIPHVLRVSCSSSHIS